MQNGDGESPVHILGFSFLGFVQAKQSPDATRLVEEEFSANPLFSLPERKILHSAFEAK